MAKPSEPTDLAAAFHLAIGLRGAYPQSRPC